MLNEILSDLRYRVRALVRRDALEGDLDAEVRYHLEREAQKYEAAGMSRDDALRRARLAFGGVDRAKEESRDGRGTALVEATLQDIRYALRGLRAKPGFTIGVVLTLGLGIGANAAMFGIVDKLLFRSPPGLRDAKRVHRLYLPSMRDGVEQQRRGTSYPRFVALTTGAETIDAFAGFQSRALAVGTGDASREIPVGVVTASFFRFFDAPPVLGRYFSPEDDRAPEGMPVVVLSYAYWQTQFGGRTDVLGTKLEVDQLNCTIIGVAPRGFVGVGDQYVSMLYIPLTAYAFAVRGPRYTTMFSWSWMEILVHRAPGASVTMVGAELTEAYRRSWLANESTRGLDIRTARPRIVVGPIQLERGPQASRDAKVVTWVGGVAVIVLLIACANVANLLLSRAVTRRREMALRLALGVSGGRLIRQLMTETLVLAGIGGLAGIATAQWGGAALRALYLSAENRGDVVTDSRTLAFALLATLIAAMLTGLAPAARAVRGDLALALSGGGRDVGVRPSSLRTALLLFQATLSVVLLVGAGLFVRSLQHVRAMPLGYDVDPILFVNTNWRDVKATPAERARLEQRLVDEALATPGVAGATPIVSVPFWSNEATSLFVEGVDSVSKLGRFIRQAGSPQFFATAGTRLLRGRGFGTADVAAAPAVMVVSAGMARALWPGQDALGKCVRMGADTAPCATVIGVAEDMHIRAFADEREFTYYVPIAQYGGGNAGSLFVRVGGDAAMAAGEIRQRLQRLMPGTSFVTVQPLRELVDPNLKSWRFGATMFVAFGGLALVLAGVGLYSMIAYTVTQRRQEIGVRIALGAPRAHVVRLVVGRGMRLVLIGVVIGGAIALWAGRWIGTLLFEQSPRDPVVFGAVAAVLIGVAALASAIPAVRAARVDPNIALRND